MKVKRQKKSLYTNKHQKKPGVAKLITDKTGFKKKVVIRDKDYIWIIEPIQNNRQEISKETKQHYRPIY